VLEVRHLHLLLGQRIVAEHLPLSLLLINDCNFWLKQIKIYDLLFPKYVFSNMLLKIIQATEDIPEQF